MSLIDAHAKNMKAGRFTPKADQLAQAVEELQAQAQKRDPSFKPAHPVQSKRPQ